MIYIQTKYTEFRLVCTVPKTGTPETSSLSWLQKFADLALRICQLPVGEDTKLIREKCDSHFYIWTKYIKNKLT